MWKSGVISRKKILITILGLQFHIDEGAKHRVNSFVNSYNEKGFEIDVIIFYSLKSLPFIFRRNKFLTKKANWILYPTFPIEKNSFLNFFAITFSQLITAIYSRAKKYDIIQFENSGNLGKYIRKNAFCIVDFHGDLYSETIYRYNNKENWRSRKVMNDILFSLRISDHNIFVAEKLKKQIEVYSKEIIENCSIISCGVDVNRFLDAEENPEHQYFEDRIVLGYCGGLQKWQNIEIILDIILRIKKVRNDIFFTLITNDDTSIINGKLELLGDDSYKTFSLKSDEVPSYLKLLDAGFLIRDNLRLNTVSSPTKIVEYLAAGVPVICTKYSGDFERSVINGVNGFVLDNTKIEEQELLELVDYLVYIKSNRDLVREKCQEYAKLRAWEIEFSSFYKSIIS